MTEYKMSDELLDRILYDFDNNNANMTRNVGSMEQAISEALHKKIGLKMVKDDLPHVYEMHQNGTVHLNDLSGLYVKPTNCFNLNPKHILDNGFQSNGGENTSSSKPKHFDSALNQLMEALINITMEQTGGIGLAYFNWYLAPLFRKADEKERYQSLQTFIFRSNQLLRAGSQMMFSSLNLSMKCPEFLKNEYGSYQKEADEIIRMICEINLKGDAKGAPFRFPNLVFNITNADLDNYIEVFELAAKTGAPYFINDYECESQVMGCRSRLPANFKGSIEEQTTNCGNAVYSTVSLPMIALESKNVDVFKRNVREVFDELYKYTLFRKDQILKRFNEGLMPFLAKVYDIERMTFVIGILGYSEAIDILNVKEDNDDLLKFMSNILGEYKVKSGLRFGLFSPPSENACYRLGKKAVEKYGIKLSRAKGTVDAPYYTNGVNLIVDEPDILKQLTLETNRSKFVQAGNINNILLGEAYTTPEALKSLTEKIRDNTNSFFWAYTINHTHCCECNTLLHGLPDKCVLCGSDRVDQYSRVCGYITKTSSWNKGKVMELTKRHHYNE